MFDDDELALLEGMTEEELEQLSFEIDPEQSLLMPSERCTYKTNRPETRMYEREHLMGFMEKLAAESTVGKDYLPYKKKQTEAQPPPRRPSPLPPAQLSVEECEELSQMTETELIELAAYIGATNILTQDQIHAVEVGERPEGSAFRSHTVVKSSVPTSNMPREPEQDFDVLLFKKCLKEGNVSVITINNQPELECDVFDEVMMSLDENESLRHLSLANTGLNDKIAKALIESVGCNTVLETLNVESNYISPASLLELVKASGETSSLKELRIANQKMRLGLKYEEKIATALSSNFTLLRFGMTVENAGPRNKVDRCLIRNNDKVRQDRMQGKATYNFNDMKKAIKEAPQPWLRTRGIFKKGELAMATIVGEDGTTVEAISRLKKTGYVFEREREIPKIDLYQEEGITPEEAMQMRSEQILAGVERQAKQSSMLGELTQMLAKRRSRQSSPSGEEKTGENESTTTVQPEIAIQPPTVIQPPTPTAEQSIQSTMEREMAAALEERQRKIMQQAEDEADREEEEEDEKRRRRRGRGRQKRVTDEEDGDGERQEDSQPKEEVKKTTEADDAAQEATSRDGEKEQEQPTSRRRQKMKEAEEDKTTEKEEESERPRRRRNRDNDGAQNTNQPPEAEETTPDRSRRRRGKETAEAEEKPEEDRSERNRRQRNTRREKDEDTAADGEEDNQPGRRQGKRREEEDERDGKDDGEEGTRRGRVRREEPRPVDEKHEEGSRVTGKKEEAAPVKVEEDKDSNNNNSTDHSKSNRSGNNKRSEETISSKSLPDPIAVINDSANEAELGRPMSLRERRRLKAAAGY